MITAEGSEENLDLLLVIADKFNIKISKPSFKLQENDSHKKNDDYKNAYLPWSKSDDEKLEILYFAGKSTVEMSEFFGRNQGAIRSRIKKLELPERYGKIK